MHHLETLNIREEITPCCPTSTPVSEPVFLEVSGVDSVSSVSSITRIEGLPAEPPSIVDL